jgi:hypothetical protein
LQPKGGTELEDDFSKVLILHKQDNSHDAVATCHIGGFDLVNPDGVGFTTPHRRNNSSQLSWLPTFH